MARPPTGIDVSDYTPMLRLELFGGPVLWRGRSAVRISPFQAALLSVAYAEAAERIPRSRVQRLLWGLDGNKSVRHRLSQLIYQVNQNCQARVVELESEYMRVSRHLVWCDLDEFEERIGANDYENAYMMFDRGFLPALSDKRAETLSDWLDDKRRALRNRLRTSALEHWDAAEAAHDWTAARTAAEVLLRLNPGEEPVLRRVMRAHAMTGQVRELEASYRAFAERAAPMGAWVPEPETLELLKDFKPPANTAPENDLSQAEDPGSAAPFLGRKDAITPLRDRIANSGARWKTLAVSGEAGSGKTRLMQELFKNASLRGYTIVTASSAEMEAGIPMSLALDILGQPRIQSFVDGLPAPWKSILLSLLPQTHAMADGVMTAHIPNVQHLTRQTCEAFLHLFTAIAQTGKTILFLDDFHWADEASVRLLEFLARRWKRGDFTVALAYQLEDMGGNGIVPYWLRLLKADPAATIVVLDGLETEPARRLARSVAPRGVSDAAIERIVGLAGGNPRYLVDLAVDWPIDGQRHIGRNGIKVPLSVERSLIRRVRGLSDHARKVLSSLSVFGQAASLGQLLRIADCTRYDLVNALEELQDHGLVALATNGVRVRQEIVGSAIYERLSPARRTLLHARTAELLKAEPDRGPLELIAIHYFWAGNHDSAYLYAIEAVKGTSTEDVSTRLDLLTVAYDVSTGWSKTLVAASLARVNHRACRLHAALRFGREALRTPDESPQAESAGIRLIVADTLHRLGLEKTEETLDEFSAVEEAARAEGDELPQAIAAESRAYLLERVADHDAMAQQLVRIGKLESFEDPAARSRVFTARSRIARHTDPQAAVLHARHAVDVARDARLQDETASALHCLATALMTAGQLTVGGGWQILDEAKAACRKAGHCGSVARLLIGQADWQTRTGDYDTTAKTLAEAGAVVDPMDCPQIRAMLGVARGNLALATGDIESAESALRCTRSMDAVSDEFASLAVQASASTNGALGGLEGIVLLESGKIGLAAKVAQRHPLGESLEHDPEELLLFHSRLKSRAGDLSAALDLLERALAATEPIRPMSWLRLALELVRLARRSGTPLPGLASRARVKATELGLPAVAHQFGPFCGE